MDSLQPSASSLSYALRFLAFLLVCVLPVGHLALRSFRISLSSRLETFSLALVAGTLAVNSYYLLLRWQHQEKFLVPTLALLALLWIFVLLRAFPAVRLALGKTPSRETLCFLLTLLLILLYHFIGKWSAIRWTPEGGLILGVGAYADPIWKMAIISELEHSVPPQMPNLAGERLAYHYFFDLFHVLIHHVTRIDLLNLRYFWVPLYSFTLFASWIFILFRRIFQNGYWALGSLVLIASAPAVNHYLYATHGAFAILLFFSIILLISEALRAGEKRPWILVVLMLSPLMMFESVLSLSFIPALGLGALTIAYLKRRLDVLGAVSLGILLAGSFYLTAAGRVGGGGKILELSFPVLQESILSYPPAKQAFTALQGGSWVQTAIFVILAATGLILTLIKYLGVGLFSLPLAAKKLRDLPKESPETLFLVTAFAVSFLVPLFFGLPVWRGASLRMFNFAGLLAKGLAAGALIGLWRGSLPRKTVAAAGIVLLVLAPIAVSLPDARKGLDYYSYRSPQEMEVFHYLRTQTPPDSILMHPFLDDDILDSRRPGAVSWVFKDHYYYGSALGGRRVVMEGPKNGAVAILKPRVTPEDISRIRQDIRTIYSTQDAAEALDLLRKYQVSYLWVPAADPLHFSSPDLRPVVQNQEHALYQVPSGS